ncbi:hypothetical protein O6H91_Y368600 [Diphasiastrum complanatum]|nr:hypothetical protein O6H91_Y368600 [Diphasiastrum complanatum]
MNRSQSRRNIGDGQISGNQSHAHSTNTNKCSSHSLLLLHNPLSQARIEFSHILPNDGFTRKAFHIPLPLTLPSDIQSKNSPSSSKVKASSSHPLFTQRQKFSPILSSHSLIVPRDTSKSLPSTFFIFLHPISLTLSHNFRPFVAS